MVTHIRYTTAGPEYDGFGTVELEVLPLKNKSGREPYRKVEITDEALDWQTNRYASGMHPRLDEATFSEWREANLIVPVEP